jgi:hypothetical protein
MDTPKVHCWILGGPTTTSLEILKENKVIIHYIIGQSSISHSMKEINLWDWVLVLSHKDVVNSDIFDILKENKDTDVIIGLHSIPDEEDSIDLTSFRVTEREGLSGTFIKFHVLVELNLFEITNEFSIFDILFKMQRPMNLNCNNSPMIPLKIKSQTKACVMGTRKENVTKSPHSAFFRFQNTIERLNSGVRIPPPIIPPRMKDLAWLKKEMKEYKDLSSLLETLVEDCLQISEYVNGRIKEFEVLFQ